MRGKKQEARNHLVSEVELAPEDTDTLVAMASMFLEISDIDLTIECLLKAVDLDCANADAYYYLGLVTAMKGQFADAAEFFAHTLDIRPENVCALRDSAVVYLAMGRFADAAEKIKKARLLADEDLQLKALEHRVRAGQIIERIEDFLCRWRPRFVHRKSLQ
jgi:tetratricopeptide (TPR) repeat protein